MRVLRAARVAAVAWVAITSSGCMVWRVESVPPRELLRNRDVSAVRITSTDSLSPPVEIHDPRLVGDSISGHPSKLAIARVVVPLSRVKTIATQRKSFGKTVLVGLAIVGAVGAYALLQSLNQGY